MSREIWITSDTHLFHSNILKFKDSDTGNLIRGEKFSDVDQMNQYILDKWNSVVKPGDIVYHLGDVFIGNREDFKNLWPKFQGSKRLVVGNHDDIPFLSSGGFFKKVMMWRTFPEFGLMLSHVPLHQSSLERYMPDGGKKFLKNCHGHIHQNPSPDGPYQNMCVEITDYTPINIEELRIN